MNRILDILFLLVAFLGAFIYFPNMFGEEVSDYGKEFVMRFKKWKNSPINMDYIDPFDTNPSEEFQRMKATELVDSMIISTRSDDTYTIKALTFSDWDIKSGDFHCVEIYKGDKKIYEMKCMQGWDYLSERLSSKRKEFTFCRPFNVVDDTVVLLFQGTPLTNQLPSLPIVVIKKGKAQLVFNKPYKVLGVSYNTLTKAFYFLSKTTESANLYLMVEDAKYDEGNMIERPIYKNMQILEQGIGFGLDYYKCL